MPSLFDTFHTEASLTQYGGRLSQFGGVRLIRLEDGPARGVRVLEFDTGSGLRFDVAVDRAMDISAMSHNGRPVGWQSPTGIKAPAPSGGEDDGGLGWMRGFSGLLATCGLDHIGGPEVVPAANYNYPRKENVQHSLHGRIANCPARLVGFGERWEADNCILWAEGIVEQTSVFGEVLHLHRKIEADLGGNALRLNDRVVNAGHALTPHMLMYHINFGHPVVDEGARYIAPISDVTWAAHTLEAQGVGYDRCPPPIDGFAEQVWEHQLAHDHNGMTRVALVNDRLEFGVEVTTDTRQLPCSFQWQNFQSGQYAFAIEPSTHHAKGNLFARSRDEMIWLSAGESRTYDLTIAVLDGRDRIAAAEQHIRAIGSQPDVRYPKPSNNFKRLNPQRNPT